MPTMVRPARTALAAFLMILAMAVPVGAAAPRALTLVSTTTFNPVGFNYGTFTAIGPAVDDGLVCASGTFVDTGLRLSGYQNNKSVQIQVDKTYTCPSGDSFFVKMQIHADFSGSEWFTWVAQGGTGAYDSLRGSGSGTTAPNPPTGNINTFVGFLLH
jgi:hypothetical protein